MESKSFEVGDKVRLYGAEVWIVDKVFLSLETSSLYYRIRRGCIQKIVPDRVLYPFRSI